MTNYSTSDEIINEELHVLCQRYKAIILTMDKTKLTIATSNGANDELLSALRFACGCIICKSLNLI